MNGPEENMELVMSQRLLTFHSFGFACYRSPQLALLVLVILSLPVFDLIESLLEGQTAFLRFWQSTFKHQARLAHVVVAVNGD